MHLRTGFSLIVLAALLPATAQAQSVDDFTLEPAPAPTATPQAQGPADTQSGVEIRPRAVNTPTPRPTPTASSTAAQTPPPASSTSSPEPQPRATVPAPRSSPLPTVTPRSIDTAPTQLPAQATSRSSVPAAQSVEPDVASDSPPSATASPVTPAPALDETGDSEEGFPWLPISGAVALLALLGAGFFFRKRRQEALVPEIERPVVAGTGAGEHVPLADALMVRVENEKLIRSAAYATLKYRLTLINRTNGPLSDVAVGIDLVSAHAGAPMEQQIATDGTALERRHDIARISPRQSVTLQGQVQLPLAQAHVIRQGRYPLLVPLMRVRVDGAGEGALLKTFVVGQGSPDGGRVQPFRLDEGPRSYAPIAQRELA